MRIYINGRFLSQQITGVQRYAREMVLAMDSIISETVSEDEWYILAPNNVENELSLSVIKIKRCGRLTGHLWEQIELPFFAKNGFLINLCNCAPLLKKKQLVTIHDAAVAEYPEAYSWAFRKWYKFMSYICGKYSEKITTVSNFSRNQLHKHYNIPLDKIEVIYNGIDHMDRMVADDSIIDDLMLHNEDFVLAVSSQNMTKNFSLVIKVAKKLPNVKFIIVGGSNKSVFRSGNNEDLSNVMYTGYVSDEKLISLYRHASVFVYPSLYEGFGIPPLEALSQGCLTIVSHCASLPEICGDWSDYCNPNNEAELADKINMCICEKNNRKMCIHISDIKNKYSWNNSARLILNYLRK